MQFGSGSSSDSIAYIAAREAITSVTHTLRGTADLALVFVTQDFRDQAILIARLVQAELNARVVIGCTATSVLGGTREIEESSGVAIVAGSLPGVDASAFHISLLDYESAVMDPHRFAALTGGDSSTRCLVLLADPESTPMTELLPVAAAVCPNAVITGGMASAGDPPGNVLVVNGAAVTRGVVGVRLSGALNVRSVVSQGCRPIGERMLITRADGQVVQRLGGRTALDATRSMLDDLDVDEQLLAAQGLYLGIAMNEYLAEFRRGDFLVRNVLGGDPDTGSIILSDEVRAGQTVQFHVLDASSADEDLNSLLAACAGDGASPAGALLFTCNGRGQRMFEVPGHDIKALQHVFPGLPAAGFFAAGEIGKIGRSPYLHGHTASIALFEPI